jgi:long-chain acyl-CoA synthetase
MLSIISPDPFTQSEEEYSGGRVSCVVAIRENADETMPLYLPAQYSENILLCFDSLKPRDIREPSEGLPISGETCYEISDDEVETSQIAFVTISKIGADFCAAADEIERYAHKNNLKSMMVFIAFGDKHIDGAVTAMRERGYFFGGVMPYWLPDSDALLIQKLYDGLPDWDQIRLVSKRIKRIAEMIKDELCRYNADEGSLLSSGDEQTIMVMEEQPLRIESSIYESWRTRNAGHPDLTAIDYFGNQVTFAEADNMMDIYARAFLSMLPDKSKSVTFCVPTIPSTLFAFYALNKIGVRANFISHTMLQADPAEYIGKTDTEVLVLLDGFFPLVAGAVAMARPRKLIIVSLSDGIDTIPEYVPAHIRAILRTRDGAQRIKAVMPHLDILSLEEFEAIGKRSSEVVESVYHKGETAVVLYTGGSTGVPKGIEFMNETPNTIFASLSSTEGTVGAQPGIRNLILIPPNHPTCFMLGMVVPWLAATTHVLQPIYDKTTFASDIINTRAQTVFAAPSHYAVLPKSGLKPGDLSELFFATSGGEPVTMELAAEVNKALAMAGAKYPRLILGYGMSELGSTVMRNTALALCPSNKVGEPMPGVEARIVDERGNELGANERGHLEVKSPFRMKGYYKKPEMTAAFFTDDGFAKTGDMALRDENGFYDVVGRATDSFVADDGSVVYLFEIERIIYKDHAVLENEVISLDIGGKTVPVAHIVLKPEYIGKDEEAILRIHALCKRYLTAGETPYAYKIQEAFATNQIGAKRDIGSLKAQRDGYVMVDVGSLREVCFDQ